MKDKVISILKSSLRPLIFIIAGVIIGFAYYNFVGCASGTCVITSNPVITMAYTGILGGLISVITKKGDK